jgi:two-component system LytT family response regulator
MTYRAIVVDDEALGRRGIVSRLGRWPAVQVVAQCRNGREAVDAVRELRPDLLFLDVQMPGSDGFDVVASLPEQARPHVIFVTACDRHALRAFEVHALDYLLKPIDDERFDETLGRAIETLERERDSDLGRRVAAVVGELRAQPPRKRAAAFSDCEIVRDRGKVTFLRHSEIDWIEAAGDYLRLHAGGRSWLVRGTMSSAERRLAGRRFLRIHRSTMVNTDRIRELRALDNGDSVVLLRDGSELRLSRTYRDAIARQTNRG